MYYFGKHKLTDGLFRRLCQQSRIVAIDIETVSLKDTTMVGIGVATGLEDIFYFTLGEWNQVVDVLNNDNITKVFHNCMFDLGELMWFGVSPYIPIEDTSYMARILGFPGALVDLSLNIAELGLSPYVKCRGMKSVMEEYNAKTTRQMPEEVVAKKCSEDCKATLNAYSALRPLLSGALGEAYQVDIRMVPILLKLGRRGIKLDPKKVEELVNEYDKMVRYWEGICQVFELENPASIPQVAKALCNRGVLFPRRVKGKYKVETGSRYLKFKEDILAQAVLKYREVAYFLTHYATPLRGKERAFSHYHLEASTSRMSSFDMNFMNIPKGLARNCFVPDNEYFTCADGSQLQLRALAFLSQDPVMLNIYENDGDIHQETADYFHRERDQITKAANFGAIFGITDEALAAEATTDNDVALAHELIEGWKKKYHVAWDWIASQQEVGLRDGFVFTHFGRRLYIPTHSGKAHAERCSVNFPIQGVEAEIVKRWLITCDDIGKYDLANIVHDEGVYDGYYEDLPLMGNFSPFNLPMNVKHIRRWE